MIRETVLILSLICCFGLTTASGNYYPAEIGNTWIFLSADGSEERIYTLETPDNTDVEGLIALKITTEALGTGVIVTDTYFITAENDNSLLLHQSLVDQGAFGTAAASFDPPVTFFPAELPLGHKWQIVVETQLKLVGAVTSTSTIEVVAIEDVETPAGLFQDCVKLKIDQKDVLALAILRETSYQWLAPDVGPVKYIDDQDIRYELQRYNLFEKTDINSDGVVNIQDLVLISSHFGKRGESRSDVNGDGVVDIRDLVKVANAFGD